MSAESGNAVETAGHHNRVAASVVLLRWLLDMASVAEALHSFHQVVERRKYRHHGMEECRNALGEENVD